MKNKKLTLSVVITVINRDKKYLKACLLSVEKSADYANIILKIIIVANGARIINPKYLKSKYVLITNIKNIGFGQAINAGMKYVHSDWCLVLAPDTRCKTDSIVNLTKYISYPDVAIIGPKSYYSTGLLDYNITPLTNIWDLFLEQSYLYKLFPKFLKHPFSDNSIYEKDGYVDGMASTLWLINTKIFRFLGGFDSKFFLYQDDTDFCKRVKDNGYKIFYSSNSEIVHLGHKSTTPKSCAEYMFHGYMTYLYKYYNPIYFYIFSMILLVGTAMRLWIILILRLFNKTLMKNKYFYLKKLFKICLFYSSRFILNKSNYLKLEEDI